MKLTKSQFKQLLKEEITSVFETHGGLERAASLVRDPVDPMARGYQRPPQAMQRLMRVIVDTLKQEGMSDEDVIELTKELLGAGMLQTAEEAPEEVGLEEIIKEELEKSEVQAEQDLMVAIDSLWEHGYSREDIMSLADDLVGAKEVPDEDDLTMTAGKYSQHGEPVYDVLKGERKAGQLSARRANKGIYWIFELAPNEDPTEYGMPFRTGMEKNQKVFGYGVGPEDALEWLKGK